MRDPQMSCAEAKPLLEPCFEGTLPERALAALKIHLRSCPRCTWELAQIEKVAAALAAVPQTEPSISLALQISARVARLPAPAARLRLVQGWHHFEVLAGTWIVILACVRHAIPLLLSKPVVALPLAGWLKSAIMTLVRWLVAVPDALHLLSTQARGLWEALCLVTNAVAPMVGFYTAAEVAIIAAIIIVTGRARRAAAAHTLVR
jgi:anti-sigma factor RsiW